MKPRFLAGPDDGKLDFYEVAGRGSGRDAIVLEEDFIFQDSRGEIWIAPMGLEYDGTSNPRLFWTITGHPLESRHILAGGIHDQTYQAGARLTINPAVLVGVDIDKLAPATLCALPRVEVLVDRFEADYYGLLEPLLVTPGNTLLHSRIFYRAVRIGGWVAWGEHIKRRVAERVPFSRLV